MIHKELNKPHIALKTCHPMRYRRKIIFIFLCAAANVLMLSLIARNRLRPKIGTQGEAINNLRCEMLPRMSIGDRGVNKKRQSFTKRAAYFPESRLIVNTTSDENKCPELYAIARSMLDGEKIELPFETNKTRWKFRERVDLDVLAKTKLQWNYPWQQGYSNETRMKLERYNVSARTISARKYMLSYGHNCCEESKARAVNYAVDFGLVDYAEAMDLSQLSVPFQISHQKILRQRKGAGYWLWKSYIILKTLLTKMNDGDLLLYLDAGAYLIKDTGPLYKACMDADPSVLSFHQPYEESQFSKRDAFILMGMEDPRVYQKGQRQRTAALQVYMKSCATIQFAMEYMAYSADRRIVTDDKNVLGKPNFSGFVGNRHDQTVFSLLSKKWGISELRDPCKCGRNKFEQYFKYASGPYDYLYVHDRVRS